MVLRTIKLITAGLFLALLIAPARRPTLKLNQQARKHHAVLLFKLPCFKPPQRTQPSRLSRFQIRYPRLWKPEPVLDS